VNHPLPPAGPSDAPVPPPPGSGAGTDSAFRLEGVQVERNGRSLLHGVDTRIPAGRITVLFGPSGAGKSTLLRLLNRLDEPSAGEIRYRGEPITALPVRTLRCRVGFVFQTPVLFPGTVRSNLAEAGLLAGLPPHEVEARVPSALELAGVEPLLLERDGAGLSVGQKQRVTLARALMTAPETLLLDEPTSALDPVSSDHLLETLRTLREERGLTVVLTTHRLVEIRGTADHGIMLQEGRLVEEGNARRILEAPREEATRTFLSAGRGNG